VPVGPIGGVHARGQIIAFDAEWRHELADLHRALNAVLAADVAVVQVGLAREGFHPRFDAVSRDLSVHAIGPALALAVEQADSLASTLSTRYGSHGTGKPLLDRHARFLNLWPPAKGENPVRTVSQAEWRRGAEAAHSGEWMTFDITANAFLYHMVRSLVGSLVLVGSGQLSVDEFEAMLLARDSSLAKLLAPAHGLCLMRVEYKMPAATEGSGGGRPDTRQVKE